MPAPSAHTEGKLPKRYREALKALKDHAAAAAAAVAAGAGKPPRRGQAAERKAFADSQKRMVRFRPEVNAILTALARAASVDRRISVRTVGEKDLAVLLGRPDRAPKPRRRH